MGDSIRHKVLTKFIIDNFSTNKSLLIVADGKGELAYNLALAGYSCRVIEAKPRFSKEFSHPQIIYNEGYFDTLTEVREQLIIGMHPDEATADIIKSANKNNLPFVVVPCCRKGIFAHGVKNFREWLDKLQKLAGDCNITQLNFCGKNQVIYRK